MDVLVIGGTRFVGRFLALTLVGLGHRVTTFNRGVTLDELGPDVERLHGDRTEPGALARAVAGRSFDAAVDMIAMRGADTREALAALEGRVGRFVHVSTGQVYLVREGCPAPAREEDYEGPLREAPPRESWEHAQWLYGVEKRECEDLLAEACAARGFPSVRLRMPIVHGPKDPTGRLHGYLARMLDGGPLLAPEEPGPAVRHVYAGDVVVAIVRAMTAPGVQGQAFNVASDDLWPHATFVERLAALAGATPRIEPRPRAELEAAGLFPDCAPLASPWMSVLDNARARAELGLRPAGFDDFLPPLVGEYQDTRPAPSADFVVQRAAERLFAER